jgi:hypothetical protein
MRLDMPICFVFLLLRVHVAQSERTAAIHEVQPHSLDVVHTVWLNGPAHTDKAGWVPRVKSDATEQCTTRNGTFTGYTINGAYCEPGSTTLDDAAHLLVYSGRAAFVLDAAGINGPVPSRNLFPKLGSLHGIDTTAMTPKQIYGVVPASTATVTLTTTCDGATTQYFLGTDELNFVPIGLVRQGHVVTQLTLSSLLFHDAEGGLFGPCADFEPMLDPYPELQESGDARCNGAGATVCREEYPDCVGFKQGSSWGNCYSICEAPGVPQIWV